MHRAAQHRIILVDVSAHSRDVVARRLTAQGYAVEAFDDPALGANVALASPPSAVVADLWMPSISGVQLCRLLRAEPATANVPVVLRGPNDDPRSRFWAERAGAAAYVVKGRIRELVGILAGSARAAESSDEFFMQLSGGSLDIRERIARHLDLALFDSVLAAEVRALASSGSFEKLFDMFSQFLSQVVSYRWMAVLMNDPKQFAVHHHPQDAATVEAAARNLLQVSPSVSLLRIEDEDARGDLAAAEPIVCAIPFGPDRLGSLAVAISAGGEPDSLGIVQLVARELGGPLRIAALMDTDESNSDGQTRVAALRQALQQFGWTEGRNIRIDLRWGGGDVERTRGFAAELVHLSPDVIFAYAKAQLAPLSRETRTIPIVFCGASAPVTDGFIASFAHPGGNITGFTQYEPSMVGKWLETLKEIAPATGQVAIVVNPETAPLRGTFYLREFENAAATLGVKPIKNFVHNEADVEAAIAALGQAPNSGLIVAPETFTTAHRKLFIAEPSQSSRSRLSL